MDLTAIALRPVRAADLGALDQLGSPAASGFNWSGYRSQVSLQQRFEKDGYLAAEDGWLIIVSGDDDEFLGSVGWRAINWSTPPYSRAWSIGITVAPPHRQCGVGTRAQQLLCDYLFSTTSINRVEAVTNAANVAEQHALRAAGFTQEGVLRQAEFRVGAWHDLVMFSRLRSEWSPAAALH